MKKNTQHRSLAIVILGILLLINTNTSAQVLNNFTSRFNETVNGDVTIIANNMISRTASTNYNGEDGNHDFIDNIYVDIDNNANTFNSSSANFTNPEPTLACLTIRKAYLYWAASDKETNGNDNQPNWNFNEVMLMLPGQTTYTTIAADEIIYRGRDFHFSNDPYVCFKDITNLVTNLNTPYGTYQIANVEGKIGGLEPHPTGNTGVSGGWQIAYVYESPELTTKNISLFDGYAHVTQSFNNFDVDFNGFQTIPAGPVNANIVIGALEGDRDLQGDMLQIRNTANTFVDLTAPLRDANNFFNSRITVGNNEFLDRIPASTNTLGFDAAVFPLDNTNNSIINNNQTSATVRLTSNQETYGLFLIGLSVDVWSPNLYPIRLTTDAENQTVESSQNVLFDFNFSNNGNDDAINVELSTILPDNLEFVGINNLPNGVTYSYDNNTRILQFFVEDGLADVGDPQLAMQFELQIKEECYFLEQSCNLVFDLQLTATYNGVENPTPRTTLSSHGLDDCQLGTVLPMTIIQPDAALWVNPAGDLDRIIDCDDPNGLIAAQILFPNPDKCNFNLIKTSGPFVPISGCGSPGTYTNTWTFTDACGRTIADYTQTVTIMDSTPPTFDALPSNTVIDCSQAPNFTQPTVSDSCSSNINLTFEDITTNGSCEGDYIITRTWTAVDDCGNSSSAAQIVLMEDTTAPVLTGTLNTSIFVSCQLPPDIPTLSFSDNCSVNIDILFSEDIITIDASNYDIVRTWEVYDDCANESTFVQTIHMETSGENSSRRINLCADDLSIDLNNYVDESNIGYWQSNYLNVLNNTEFDPSILAEGEYTFNYISTVDRCVQIAEIIIEVGEACIELNKCIKSSFDVDISKLVTPNNDGMNDMFDVAYILNSNLDERKNCNINVKVKVFNRWGTKVFQSDDYSNNWTGTSGGRVGGAQILPSGTYYYVVNLENSGLKPIQGYILLGIER